MPWKERTAMSLRLEFVKFALADGSNIAQLCRRFDVSRKTGYKWIKRYRQHGDAGLADLCRRPKNSPRTTSDRLVVAILQVRKRHRAWGGRKIRKYL